MQVGSNNSPGAAQVPEVQRSAQATGILAGIGRWGFGWALNHEAPLSLDGRAFNQVHPECSALITDISNQVIKVLLKETKNSSIVAGGCDQLGTTIIELAEGIFSSLGQSDNENMSDDEFIDHVLASVIKIFRDEFATDGTPREHFIRIADTLFEKAFPEGVQDPRLPKILKEDKTSRLARFALSKAKGIDLSWNGIKSLFANYLEQTYTAFTNGQNTTLSDERLPGANQLIDYVMAKIDSKTKETDALELDIPLDAPDAKNFVNRALLRLVKGQFIQENDTQELQAARKWLLDNIKSSVKSVYQTIFALEENQTEGERLNQFAENLLVRMCEVLPNLENGADIKQAIRKILEGELDPEKLQPLLPGFLSAEMICDKIYTALTPYLTEIMDQSLAIQSEGAKAAEALTSNEGGQRIGQLLEDGLAKLWNVLQTKAEAQTFEPTDYEFINTLLGHVLLPSTLAKVPEVKKYINSQLKNIVSIVLKDAIGPKGLQDPEKAVAELMNRIIEEAQQEVVKLMDETDDIDAKLLEAAKRILSTVVTEERLQQLLPKFLKNSDIWKSSAELLSDKLLKGLYNQATKIQNIASPDFVLPQELRPQLDQLNAKIVAALESPGEATLLAQFLRGPGVLNLVKGVLPKLLDTVVAYHVHPVEDKTSEERTAELILSFAASLMKGFEAVANYEKSHDYEGWLQKIDPEVLKAYRKDNNIPRDKPLDVRAYILREQSKNLVARLLPEDLLQTLLPQEFTAFKLDKLLEDLCFEYMDKAYDYANVVNKVEVADGDLQNLQKYMVDQIGEYFAKIPESKRTWFDNVARAIFAQKDDEVMGFLLNFGALGVVLKNIQGSETGLEVSLGPIVDNARKVFSNMDDLDQVLHAELKDYDAYKAATGKDHKNDMAQFAYWLLARRALDLVSDEQWKQAIPILKKEVAATLLMKLYETAHKTQQVLQQKYESGTGAVGEKEGLKKFVDDYFVKNLKELLVQLGSSSDPLAKTLPTILDELIKQILSEGGVLGDARNALLEKAIYSVMGKILTDEKDPVTKIRELVACYNEGNNDKVARLVLKEALPEELAATSLGRVLINEAAPIGIGILVKDIRTSQDRIMQKAEEAKNYVNRLDDKSMKLFVEGMLTALDSSLDALALDPKKLSDILPEYMDTLIKDVFKDKDLMPIVKEALHDVVYIVLQQVLTPKEGQSVADRVAEVVKELISIYDSKNPNESAAKWLKLLLPEEALRELLPDFMKKAITHEKLVEWFFEPYAAQIVSVTKTVSDENAIKPSETVARAQNFVQKQLQESEDLLGFGGVVAEIEKKLLGSDSLPELKSYLHAAVGHVTRTLEERKILDPRFLSNALIHALPQMNATEGSIPEDFARKAAEELLKTLFPQGSSELPVPIVVQAAVWNKVLEAMEGLFNDLTTADTRTLFMLDRLLPLTSDDKNRVKLGLKEVAGLRARLVDRKLTSVDRKQLEKLFKKAFVQTAVHQVDVAIKKEKLWGPFKWIKAVVVKAVTYLAVRCIFQNKIYSFISSRESDEKFQRLIWALVTYRPTDLADDTQAELIKQLKITLEQTNTAPGLLRGTVAKYAESAVANKSILDLIAPESGSS